MNVDAFLQELTADPSYAGQIEHIHVSPARPAVLVPAASDCSCRGRLVTKLGFDSLYSHQAAALDAAAAGRDVLVATGTASGKTLCYALPVLEALAADREARALLLYPTKALCQDQCRHFRDFLERAGLAERPVGVLDGDTPPSERRRLRDRGAVVLSNPDMVHAGLLPQHGRWSAFLAQLRFLVLDELHVYSGILGSNMALLLTRLFRVCRHYGGTPQVIATAATLANLQELAQGLAGRRFTHIDRDGSPRGRRVTVFWNPPRQRATIRRSRRSANVEAHELMVRLVRRGIPTITFSKAKMTAEMIYRYVTEGLRSQAPQQASKVTAYRGGYRAPERREIERRLFAGELLGVSTTPALELGIDVGTLAACIIVGYPGTRASFLQQAGRAGRRDQDAVVFLVGLDTAVNQYIMNHPEYVFGSGAEEAVIDPWNPFVAMAHLRCATHELPLAASETAAFGPCAVETLELLQENGKVQLVRKRWYYSAREIPHYEVSLRSCADANVVIHDADTDSVLGELNRYDAPPLLHPGAIYIHRGDTFLVEDLDLDRNLARVRRTPVDYYTQALGGTDVHHIDQQLREKPVAGGMAYWGEVTSYFRTYAFEKIHFYSLDAVSVHGLELPTLVLETMAFWLVPPESLMQRVRKAGLDPHSGLRGIGYATRMLLPLFMTCDTRDFSHTVGSVNSPWQALFVYERCPLGQGFTEKAYEQLERILPWVRDAIRACPCQRGCPCCVGKPLRQTSTWNVERGEGSIPGRDAALMILDALVSELQEPSQPAAEVPAAAARHALTQALRRRLERGREPQVFHPITPRPGVKTQYPEIEPDSELGKADVARRAEHRRAFERDMHKRLAKRIPLTGLTNRAARKHKRGQQ